MIRNRPRARAVARAPFDPRPLLTLAAGSLLAILLAGAAFGQARQGPTTPPTAAPADPESPAVRQPPPVDPGIQVRPKTQAQLPTPVIHPPSGDNGVVVVPK